MFELNSFQMSIEVILFIQRLKIIERDVILSWEKDIKEGLVQYNLIILPGDQPTW